MGIKGKSSSARRRYPHIGGRKHQPKGILARRLATLERAAQEKRTPAEQLAHLDKLLGPGVGAKKERARLLSQ